MTRKAMIEDKANLLIVDDQPDNIRIISAILSQSGYRVRKATTGKMALRTAQSEPPDLILLDVKMPDMDGYTVCSELKAIPETRDIPILFLSALDDVDDKVKAFEVGGSDYITKPFQAEEVLIRVGHQLLIQQQQKQIREHNRRLQQEIQEHQQTEAEMQLLLDIIYAIDQASDFDQALQAVLSQVCRVIAWDYGEAWGVDEQDSALHLKQAHYDPDDLQLQQFHQAGQSLVIPCGTALPGRVWATQEAEWLEDVAQGQDLRFLQSEVATAVGLKTALGVPIVLEGQVLVVLVFLRRRLMAYDAKLMHLVNAIALQLGHFMQRKQIEASLRQANQELQCLANLDGLTQVANRRHFDQVLDQEWRRQRRTQSPLSLILCDIDYFKRYNDYYGHLAGDSCLKQIAQAIARVSKRPADFVARYGGEEFVILLPDTDLDGAVCIAQQIRSNLTALAIPHETALISPHVTLSIGIASCIPSSDITPDWLIETADRGLYAAKAQGRNTYRMVDLSESSSIPLS